MSEDGTVVLFDDDRMDLRLIQMWPSSEQVISSGTSKVFVNGLNQSTSHVNVTASVISTVWVGGNGGETSCLMKNRPQSNAGWCNLFV